MQRAVIIHYNTPELAEAAIRSLWKHTPRCAVTVFDNSDKRPFVPIEGVEIIDNTEHQLIDFDAWVMRYSNRIPYTTEWGSEKHILSVDYVYERSNEGFLLMDSDVLIKRDVSDLFDNGVAWKGEVEYEQPYWFKAVRLLPHLLWINAPLCRGANIHFKSEGRIYKVSHNGAPYYDTGGSFFWDCKAIGMPGSEIKISDYAEHLRAGSHHRTEQDIHRWLELNKDLYL